MTKTYKYTTQRGAIVEATITVNHITRETVNTDGIVVEITCDKWERTCDRCKVNGKETALHELNWTGSEIVIGKKDGRTIKTILPKDIVDEIFAGQRTKAAAERKAEAKYDAHCEMMREAMKE